MTVNPETSFGSVDMDLRELSPVTTLRDRLNNKDSFVSSRIVQLLVGRVFKLSLSAEARADRYLKGFDARGRRCGWSVQSKTQSIRKEHETTYVVRDSLQNPTMHISSMNPASHRERLHDETFRCL